MPADLTARRHTAADDEFSTFDFSPEVVGQADGWEFDTPGVRYDRVVWFTDPANPDGEDTKGSFTVIFASPTSDEIADAYGTINGEDVGRRPARNGTAAP